MTVECACEHCGHEFETEPEGGHRLLCGDATSASDVARLMDGEEADICFTSPPYAQQRDYKTGPQDWHALMQGVFSVLPVKHGAQVLVNLGLVHHDGEWLPYWDSWIEWMRSAGWRRFGWYVWDQGPGLPGDWNGRLAPSHEFIFLFEPSRAMGYLHANTSPLSRGRARARLPEIKGRGRRIRSSAGRSIG
jgi:DNA modification methylase